MITRDEIRELAQLEFKNKEDCALSFYFQPQTPQDQRHRQEKIQAKDLVQNAMRESAKNGGNGLIRARLQRILELAEHLHGNQARAKAVFADGHGDFWREFDLPPQLPGTQLFMNQRFHLKPLAMLLGAQPLVGIALVDRHRARLFDLRLDELTERESLFHPLPRRGRGDGWKGYDGGHAERSVEDEAIHHFKNVADHLLEQAERGLWEKLVIGCHDQYWSELESYLHPDVKQRLLGHFSMDVASATLDQVRSNASRILQSGLEQRRRDLFAETLDQARSHRRGATGLRRVLRSLEMGEVQTIVMSENFSARAVECTNCGHLDSHLVKDCPACGRETRELEDVSDAIIPAAIRQDIELFYMKDQPELDQVGNIAALLRFRADQSTGLAVAS